MKIRRFSILNALAAILIVLHSNARALEAAKGSAYADLGNLNGNCWGSNIDPHLGVSVGKWNTTDGTEVDAVNITVSADADSVASLSSTAIPSDITCPTTAMGHTTVMAKAHPKPLTVPDTTGYCDSLWAKVNYYAGGGMMQQTYDSAKKFVETCPHNFFATWAFDQCQGAVQVLAYKDTSLWVKYRQWLESVLYLNTTDPNYFCKCVEAIGGTYHSFSDSTETLNWKEDNRSLSIGLWLYKHSNCNPNFPNDYASVRRNQQGEWYNDTTVPYDTTLYTMQQLGLDSLLAVHFKYAWVPNGGDFGKHVASYSVSENPLHEATTLRFELTDAEYVRVEVFDVLGAAAKMAAPREPGALMEQGAHSMPISLEGQPAGTYYLRITLGTGEVRTMKLVKS